MRCLERLAPGVQTLAAECFEVIVSDDGVRATAQDMVALRFPWARWIAGPKKGPAANRNHAVLQARGEWIVFTDDDCLPSPAWISSFQSAITGGIEIYEGKTTCEAGVHSAMQDAPVNLSGGWLWSCNFMIRKEAFRRLGGFDEEFPYPHMEDTDLRERIKVEGLQWRFIPGAVVDHPPKRRPWGRASGAMLESEVMYWYKQGNTRRMSHRLLWNVLRARTRRIGSTKLGIHSVSAFWSLLAELCFLATHAPGWETKYRKKYHSRACSVN